MKYTIYGILMSAIVLVSVFAFAACSAEEEARSDESSSNGMRGMDHNSGEMNHGDPNDKKSEKSDFSGQRNESTLGILAAFEKMKAALDANDKANAVVGAKALLTAFKKFNKTEIPQGKRDEFAEIQESAEEHAEHIVKSDLAHQKEHFESLTKDIKDLLELLSDAKEEKQGSG
ncbi:MAG: DUF3347 domain-containing protein [Pyrinomonadaceae bacterium]|nr:DUF3347 domain-containing protein [Pyrinomonadaceae bacterium]